MDRKSNSNPLMLEIKKIRLNELEEFVNSEEFQQLEVVPVTPARVKSYIENPRANPNDVVLYLGFIEKKLIAFRSLFADEIISGTEIIRFGWCSGNWVHPDFRRKGFSEKLLQEAFNDWDGKLMFTNYAGESEKLYLKTGWFFPIHQFEGVRAYLFPKTRKLIPTSNKNGFFRLFFSQIDFFIAVISSVRLLFYSPKDKHEIRLETLEFPDEQCFRFIEENTSDFLFSRNESELKWIFNFPWISITDRSFIVKYPFSSFSENFYYRTVKIFENNTFAGFFIFSVREGHLKTLYFFIEGSYENEIATFLKTYCKTYKIERVTVYNTQVANQIIKRKFPFLQAKKFGQKIYSTFEIENIQTKKFQDGDGDLFFT
jgi:GNAT superfamily N-acetyltransferase